MFVCAYRIRFNFRGFRGSIAIRESFIPRKFRPDRQRLCNYVTNRENKNAKNAKVLTPRKLKCIRYAIVYGMHVACVYTNINKNWNIMPMTTAGGPH